MEPDLCLAPVDELVRYLAILRRSLLLIRDYGKANDRAALGFGSKLANALHNLPHVMLHFHEKGWWTPRETEAWLTEKFPSSLRANSADHAFFAAYSRILSPAGMAEDLGLRADRSDLDLAPSGAAERYLDMIYEVLLGLRVSFNHSTEPPWWADKSPDWSAELDERASYVAVIAGFAAEIPPALVRWRSFDSARLWREAIEASETLPGRFQADWRASLEGRLRSI